MTTTEDASQMMTLFHPQHRHYQAKALLLSNMDLKHHRDT
jgi:hypothetical protein